ncbi:hypothetical protein [Limnohabitans curvus]|nr:hypothetical protein [Limnohabitans curvus]
MGCNLKAKGTPMFTVHELATEPTKINLKEVDYSCETQTRFNIGNEALAITWNATQTFDHNGKPKDSDNDN